MNMIDEMLDITPPHGTSPSFAATCSQFPVAVALVYVATSLVNEDE